MYFNARSIKNKNDKVLTYVKSENLDMVGIVETWENGNEFEAEFNSLGYKLFHQDRDDKKGGGVLLYDIHACEQWWRQEIFIWGAEGGLHKKSSK